MRISVLKCKINFWLLTDMLTKITAYKEIETFSS